MFNRFKGKTNEESEQGPRSRSRGSDPGRPTFGFQCSPEVSARLKLLADRLHVPYYILAEHALEDFGELVDRLLQDAEESRELRQHLEYHISQRTIEKIDRYDKETADILQEEWNKRSRIEATLRQIVNAYVKRGMKPEDVPKFIEEGARSMNASRRQQ